jgi:hypothetical protein
VLIVYKRNVLWIFSLWITTTAHINGKYCNGFEQRIARQQLCKHNPTRNIRWGSVFYVVRATPSAGNGPINLQSDTWHVVSLWSKPFNNRVAVFSVRGPRQEDIRKTGIGIDWTWVPKFQGNSSVARRRIRRVWRYMRCSTSILRLSNVVRLLQFLCYKSLPGNGE